MTREPATVIDKSDESWHVDRKIPVAVLLAFVVQTSGIVWWGATASERLSAVERRVEFAAPQADRLTRLEVNVEAIKDSLNEIKATIRSSKNR